MRINRGLGTWGLVAALAWLTAGCGDSAERQAKIREEASKAAETARPALEEASRDVNAAVQGAKEGWDKGGVKKLDLNAATEDDLTGLPGIGAKEAKKIIKGRPYHDAHDLVSKKILSESSFDKIKDDIRAN